MAGHNNDGSAEHKTEADLPTINVENLKSSMKTIYYSRTFLSIIAGVIAGIMGFTSLTGFNFYFLVVAFISLALVVKSFVLFWTFAYDIIHIF